MKSFGETHHGRTFQGFVNWARAQGWRYAMAPVHLANFERFLEHRGVQQLADVDAVLLIEYQRDLSITRGPATVNGYMSMVRALWRYLLREDLGAANATIAVRPFRPDYFMPHLYSASELCRIEQGARTEIWRTRTPGLRFCRRTRHAAFGLLRDCGLRVSEACRLNINDYDRRARTLQIERTKFFKTRHIPLPRTTCALLNQYLKRRLVVTAATDAPTAFFISMQGRRLGRGALESTFKQLLCKLGLYRPRRREGRTVFGSSNLHALRHSYAVRTLERWQRQRQNVEHLLPLLSGYLGHAQVSYTAHYLHLTPTLRQLASERFADLVLPRLDHGGALAKDKDE